MSTHYDVIVIGGGATGEHADRRRHRYLATAPRRHVPGARRRGQSGLGEPREASYEAVLSTDAGEWLGQATPAIRARLPLDVLLDAIPVLSEVNLAALISLQREMSVAEMAS